MVKSYKFSILLVFLAVCMILPLASSETEAYDTFTSVVMQTIIGLVALAVLIFTVGWILYYVYNNFHDINAKKAIMYALFILILVIFAVIVMNHIVDILNAGVELPPGPHPG